MADVSDAAVRVHSVARGDGRTLLFTHGWGATSFMFEPSAIALASHFRVVTWDQRGHGASESPSDPSAYSVGTTIADMAMLLDRNGSGRGILVGHSLGGYLSLEFTRRYPERVEALVLVGAGPGFRDDEARGKWNRFTARIADRAEARGLTALQRERDLHGDLHSSIDGLVKSARGVLPQHDSTVLDSLPSISVPVLVIVGEHDLQFRASADHLAAKIPDAQLVVVSDAGHSINVEQPAVFEHEVVSFVRSRFGG